MKSSYALEKTNLILMAIVFAIIILGFTLMIGGDSTDGVSFNPEIFSFQRVTVAPMIALFGFIFEIFAILWRPKKGDEKK